MMQKKGTTLNLAGDFISAVRFVGLVSFTLSFWKMAHQGKNNYLIKSLREVIVNQIFVNYYVCVS